MFKSESTNGLNIDLPPWWARVKKAVHGAETYSPQKKKKKKSPGAVVSKEGHADSVLQHEITHHYWFLWKRCNCKQCFQLLTP